MLIGPNVVRKIRETYRFLLWPHGIGGREKEGAKMVNCGETKKKKKKKQKKKSGKFRRQLAALPTPACRRRAAMFSV